MSGAGPLVLVIEDEPQMRQVLRLTLETNGMRYVDAITAREAINKLLNNQPPDLIIADLGLPDGDGLSVIRTARKDSTVPIIVLSARSQEADKIAALDAGADDYVTKPFAVGELLARLRVGLRHTAIRASGEGHKTFTVRELHVDLLQRQVTVRNAAVHLTPIEYRLLVCLISKAGQVVMHADLLKSRLGPRQGRAAALFTHLHDWIAPEAGT